jgi:hypothetical protein
VVLMYYSKEPTFEMPKWLRSAMKDKVLDFSEAWAFQELRRFHPEQMSVELPPELYQASDRLDLYERRAWPTKQ